MTKAELIEVVCRDVEMTRKDSQVIRRGHLWTAWCVRCAAGIASRFGVLEASARANGRRAWGAIRKRAHRGAPVESGNPSQALLPASNLN